MTRPHIKLRLDHDTPLFDTMPILTVGDSTCRITCRVCHATFPGLHTRPAQLCDPCAADLSVTTAHIHEVWAASEQSYYETYAGLTTLIDAADDTTQARYNAVRDALHACLGMPDELLKKRLDMTEAKGDTLSSIVKAARGLIAAKYHRTKVEAWARQALDTVEAWEGTEI